MWNKGKDVLRLTGLLLLMALATATLTASSCANKKKHASYPQVAAGPSFNADSAYLYCQMQCDFGYRTVNSDSHERCKEWIAGKFLQYGMTVSMQEAELKGYDGTKLNATNIIASYRPELSSRILLCAHWDTRPWADNDEDSSNWHKPVMGANDGASGVAILIETARLIDAVDTLGIGVDFVCFDAEDYGVPQWSDMIDDNSWALGSQYWAEKAKENGYSALFGILLDMVGGTGALFYQEGMSLRYAPRIVDMVWHASKVAGYRSFFLDYAGGYVTDDHISINDITGIPTIDIIPFYPDCEVSSFGPLWHTVDDTMENIDKTTLRAVGQTVIQVLFSQY